MRFKSRSTSIAARLGLLLVLVLTSTALKNTLSTDDLWGLYDKTVFDSATYRHSNLRTLYPLKVDASTRTTTVVTLTSYNYPMGQQALTRDVWVTAVPEVQQKCQKFTDPDLQLRLRELLGLQPTAAFSTFTTMTVRVEDIFRPAANPITITKELCDNPQSDSTCGELFPGWVGNDHKAWIANKALTSYLVSPDHNGSYSYPWTRLGYTYDWKPGADRYGASEYVVRPGSIVTVTSATPYAQYCSPN